MQIVLKIFQLKIIACPANAEFYMAFWNHFSIANFCGVANFDGDSQWLNQIQRIDWNSYQGLCPSLFVQPSEDAVLIYWNLSRNLVLGQVICYSAYCVEQDIQFCSDARITQRPLTDQKLGPIN